MSYNKISRKVSQPWTYRNRGGIIGVFASHSVVIELFAKIVVKYEVKPVENLKGIHVESNCRDVYSSMLIFQSQWYYLEDSSVWNFSEEIITKTSEEWALLKR